ncbi:MAG: WecB/TagA/CpsF family glycosyltransferase [Verrucomicrobiae bacterium]
MKNSKLALPFWQQSCGELLRLLDTSGGYLVAPSAPSLCMAADDEELWKSHLVADHAVMDSGYLSLLLLAMGRPRPPRISGHQVMEHLLFEGSNEVIPFRQRKVLWVMPNEKERGRIGEFLTAKRFDTALQYYYIAPFYTSHEGFKDRALREKCREFAPDWIILCIGGGRQEKLGAYLRTEFGPKPAIIATGAAIAFFTGSQFRIPRWADRLYLGWLLRTVKNPRWMIPRYAAAVRLPLLLSKLVKKRP